MDKALHGGFERFCEEMGMSMIGATEKVVGLYMDKMNKAVEIW